MAKLGFAAVISPVPVANKVKRDYFELWPDLDMTRDLFWEKFTQKILKKYMLKDFDCCLARLAMATRSRVRWEGRIWPRPSPPRGPFGQIP